MGYPLLPGIFLDAWRNWAELKWRVFISLHKICVNKARVPAVMLFLTFSLYAELGPLLEVSLLLFTRWDGVGNCGALCFHTWVVDHLNVCNRFGTLVGTSFGVTWVAGRPALLISGV